MFYLQAFWPEKKQKTRQIGGFVKKTAFYESAADLFLPSALLVAVRLEALPAFVFRHLQTSFLLKVSHGKSWF